MASKHILVVSLTMLLLATVSFAATEYEVASATERPYQAISKADGLTLEFSSFDLTWEMSELGGQVPVLPGAGESGGAGAPRLPVYNELVAVPAGMDLAVADVQVTWQNLGVYDIAHDGGPDEDAVPDIGLFEKAFTESHEVVTVGETGRWRDLRIAPVAIRPMRVDPATGEVQVAQSLSVDLTFVPGSGDDGFDPPGISEAMLPLYEQYVVNATDFINYDEVVRGSYLIIYPSLWQLQVETLANWRTRTGFNVIMATTDETGTSFSSIYNFINNVYQSADPPLEYVVLVGDVDAPANIATDYIDPGVPAPLDPDIATDHRYTYDIAGNDTFENLLPRYLIGRISVDSTPELVTVINKILQYEKTPTDGNPDRWTRAVTIADRSYAISCDLTQDWVKEKMLMNGFTNVAQVVRISWGNDPGPQAIANAINDDVSWVTYRGFGSHTSWAGPYFYNSDIETRITNTNNVPVITSMVCGGGAFDESGGDDPCFGEKWIRFGNPTEPKGAVAFVGPSEIDTHTRWNNMMLGGWYVSLFDQGLRTLGQCLIGAKIQLYNNYPLLWNPGGSNENSVWFYFHSYNILGDPALQLRAEEPKQLEVTHNAELRQNDSHLETLVLDSYGLPVDHAMVVITRNGTEIIGRGTSGPNGVADVLLDSPANTGTFQLTVTRPDAIPYLADLQSTDAGVVSLIAAGVQEVADDPATNGDGFINPGELIAPHATMQVMAPNGVQQMVVSIDVPPEYAGAVSAFENIGSMANGEMFETTQLQVRLQDDLPDGLTLPIRYSIVTNEGLQTHVAELPPISAPRLEVSEYSFTGDFGPGDTVPLDIWLDNNHPQFGAGTVSGRLILDDPFVTVTDQVGSWPEVGPGAASIPMNDLFEVSALTDVYPGHQAHGTLMLTTELGYQQQVEVVVEVEGAGPNAPTGPAGPGYFIFEDIDTGYDYYPDFTYQSIQPVGFDVGINDEGNNEDDVVTIDLPFTFPYWNQNYDEISICSNGWLSFGQSDFYFFRNRPLPGALTPNAAILPLWDDLILDDNNSGVYAYHDQANGWFVIEWYRVWHYNDYNYWGDPDGPPMNFQVILLDPAVHGRPGGYGQFAILYQDVRNEDGQENYLTMGLTSPDGKDALQYQFATTTVPTGGGVQADRQMLIAAAGGDWFSPARISTQPPLIQLNSVQGGQGGGEIQISNTGGRATSVEIWPEGIDFDWGLPDNEIDQVGLPDTDGYRWYDSRESFGPQYQWLDIAQPANEVAMTGGDADGYGSVSEEIDLPWPFEFYGEQYGSFWICESGYVTFTDPGVQGLSVNTSLPRPYAPLASIFPYWDNIGTDEGGAVYAAQVQGFIVITWDNVRQLAWDDEDGPYTFQLVLSPDGAIHTQYQAMEGQTISATVGIQDETGEVGLLTALNSGVPAFMENELTVRFSPGIPWLTTSPSTLTIGAGETVTIGFTADATDLLPGLHQGRLLIRSELDDLTEDVPVDFYVAEGNDLGYEPRIMVIPGESALPGEPMHMISLGPYVEDWDHADSEINWTVYGSDSLTVTIDDNHIASITPHPDWVGPAEISFRANDPNLNFNSVSALYDRNGNNDAPRFDTASPDALGLIGSGTTVEFSVQVSDPEEDDVDIEWYHNGGYIGSGTSVEVTFGLDDMGDNTILVRANDAQGETSELTWTGNIFDAGVERENDQPIPKEFTLESVYPNPFNAKVVLQYALPRTANVELAVYNVLGQQVARKTLHATRSGRHQFVFDATSWSSGVYFLDWKAGDARFVRKAMLLK